MRTHLALLTLLSGALQAEPILSSWYTEGSGRYARIWETQAQEITERGGGGTTSQTTWDSANYADVNLGDQPLPVYAGVQGISYSDDFVYIKATGLATNVMGPWFIDTARTTMFPSFPGNSAVLYRFPRSTSYDSGYNPASRTATNFGTCGLFVDGVQLFNSGDTFSYDTSGGGDQEPVNNLTGDGIWNRDAFTNEGVTFDSGNAHQAAEQFHYHASPVALRSTLGDSVDYDPSVVYQGIGGATPYTENFNGKHSPIIAWVNDGLPMYGPYGYSDPTDPSSPVRRMTSGYQPRDGSNGSTNLASTGRTTLPKWAVDQGAQPAQILSAAQYGPAVNASYVLGHYLEDYAFKGDLTSDDSGVAFEPYTDPVTQGAFNSARQYDLNQYNVRWCITPEFPSGTWAYFTSVESDGTPAYPYNLAYLYFGDPTTATGIASGDVESTGVTVVYDGAPNTDPTNQGITAEADTLTITWQGVEGGIYRIETSDDLDDFDDTASEFTATSNIVEATDTVAEARFYRLNQTGLATYDDTEFSTEAGGGGPGGGDATPGTGNPTDGFVFAFAGGPPMENLISNVQVGGVAGTVVAYALNGPMEGTVTISFDASSLTPGGSYAATFTHSPPGVGTVTAVSTNVFTKP
ncbi:YHYH protein [Haloferula sp.]|uniref:YHYH protein n=1 Tax=Haloferula sp. TaxID=2497595 RepID=UPI0032A1097E